MEQWSSGGLVRSSASDEGGEGCGCLSLKVHQGIRRGWIQIVESQR